jgi:hypothetical protein
MPPPPGLRYNRWLTRGVARTSFWDVCVIRFRASDPLRGARDLAGSRTGRSTTATGQERKRGGGRKGGRSDKCGW